MKKRMSKIFNRYMLLVPFIAPILWAAAYKIMDAHNKRKIQESMSDGPFKIVDVYYGTSSTTDVFLAALPVVFLLTFTVYTLQRKKDWKKCAVLAIVGSVVLFMLSLHMSEGFRSAVSLYHLPNNILVFSGAIMVLSVLCLPFTAVLFRIATKEWVWKRIIPYTILSATSLSIAAGTILELFVH